MLYIQSFLGTAIVRLGLNGGYFFKWIKLFEASKISLNTCHKLQWKPIHCICVGFIHSIGLQFIMLHLFAIFSFVNINILLLHAQKVARKWAVSVIGSFLQTRTVTNNGNNNYIYRYAKLDFQWIPLWVGLDLFLVPIPLSTKCGL